MSGVGAPAPLFALLGPPDAEDDRAAATPSGASDLLASCGVRAIASYNASPGGLAWFEKNRTAAARSLRALQLELAKELPKGVSLDIELRRGPGCDLAPLMVSGEGKDS